MHDLWMALEFALAMLWSMLWALILGFTLSAIVIVFVPMRRVVEWLGRPTITAVGAGTFFGAISSSCSYAATSTARSLFQKGAHIVPALAFMIASTNLVIELSAVLGVLLGWQFVLAEFVGGILMIAIMAALMTTLAPLREFEARREILNRTEKKFEEDGEAPAFFSIAGLRTVARAFVAEVRMIGRDILIGVLISGFLMAFVPESFWQSLFLHDGPPALRLLENALVGPLISILSFVCSVGNIPMAAALYRHGGGIGFGGTLSFIYADLIIIPLILIYRKYYGLKLALWITGVFYAAMVIAGVLADLAFQGLHWIPTAHAASMDLLEMNSFKLDSTLWLNLAFSLLAAFLVVTAKGDEVEKDSSEHCR